MMATTEEARETFNSIVRAQARVFNGQHADRRFVMAIEACERRTDAIARSIELLISHPDVDPIERGELIIALKSIDRRSL